MNIRYGLMSGLVLCFLSVGVLAQNAPPGVTGTVGFGGPAPQSVPATPAPIESTVLPKGHIDGIALQDYLASLHENVPDFNSVIVRQPGVPDDYPTLPPMDLKNVTIGQFLDFVKSSHPNMQVQRIDGPSAPLYVIHVGISDDSISNGGQGGGGLAPGVPAGPMMAVPPQISDVAIQVYPLGNIVDSLASSKEGEGDHVKQALDDVLSLLQTALDQTDEKTPATLKVHAPTLTLIFKGTQKQLAVLNQTIATLTPERGGQGDPTIIQMLQQNVAGLRMENMKLRDELKELNDKNATTQPTK